jgi:hypothetical protein
VAVLTPYLLAQAPMPGTDRSRQPQAATPAKDKMASTRLEGSGTGDDGNGRGWPASSVTAINVKVSVPLENRLTAPDDVILLIVPDAPPS